MFAEGVSAIFNQLKKQIRWLTGGAATPPGELVDLEGLERFNRRVLIELAEQHGNIFKIKEEGRPQICLMGLERGRALLRQHAASLRPVNIDITALVSAGFMRLMAGKTHKKYRNALIAAVKSFDTNSAQADVDTIVTEALHRYHAARLDLEDAATSFHDTVTDISTGFLVRLFFGARPGSERYKELVARFFRLGPHGVVWNIGETQKREFAEICETLNTLAIDDEAPGDASYFSAIVRDGNLDEIMLGNLIYMVEIGRYDMGGLFRWIAHNAAVASDWASKIADETDAKAAREIARAFVLETLRMDQSERLTREITDGFTFEGFEFPVGWRVRICLWETHKDPDNFALPFDFDPGRFLAETPSSNAYSPFGLDHHQCPFSASSVALGTQFLLSLLRDFNVSAVNDGASIRGAYHWEPSVDFSVNLSFRTD